MSLETLLEEVRSCHVCSSSLPLGPRPVVRIHPNASLLIIGQAPGTKVHETGIPWNDPSGDRLRTWMAIDRDGFYDSNRIAIMPMGFCYPGRAPNGGDNPPRPECAPLWHKRLLDFLPNLSLTLLVGSYAQKHYLGKRGARTMTETVRNHDLFLRDGLLPLPHPSWRTTAWQRNNPWFDSDVLPKLRQRTVQFGSN